MGLITGVAARPKCTLSIPDPPVSLGAGKNLSPQPASACQPLSASQSLTQTFLPPIPWSTPPFLQEVVSEMCFGTT